MSEKLVDCEEKIEEGIKAGDVLIKNLQTVKEKLSLPVPFEWKKLDRNNFVDIVSSCTIWINAVVEEFLAEKGKFSSKEKEK